ncbi:hypothetical protein [Streptomyces sp. NPDC058755]|uniref:hypothetical protein n=1 Tax=Streptomyces sp. NPDC058755 TaxID=3346624 RepID=UPI0036927F0C
MTEVPDGRWSFETAREPARFGAAQVDGIPGTEHAVHSGGTLCGIPKQRIVRYRHVFVARGPRACPECRRQVAAALPRPSTQERLHDRVLAAAAGSIRDDLLCALRSGAKVFRWINSPFASPAQHYVQIDELLDGAEAIAQALGAAEPVGLAQVDDGSWRFTVVLPHDGGRPAVARGTRPQPTPRPLALPLRPGASASPSAR